MIAESEQYLTNYFSLMCGKTYLFNVCIKRIVMIKWLPTPAPPAQN